MSILRYLCQILTSKVVAPITINFLVILSISYVVYQQGLFLQADLSDYTNICALGWYFLAERLLKALNELVVARFILLPVETYAIGLLSKTMTERSPASLILMKDNAYALVNAALRALLSLVENGLGIITPIVILFSRCAAISKRLDVMHVIIIVSCLFSVFLSGTLILAYDHRVKETLSKKETKISEQSRSLMTSVSTLVINGMASILPNWMTSLRSEEAIPKARHEVIMAILYGILEMATTLIPIALVWVIKGDDEFLPLYAVTQPMFWNTWWLFWTTKSLIVSTAPWAQFAEFLNNTKLPPTDLMVPDDAMAMMPIFKNSNIKEVRLIGSSGCGKSTLMKKLISQICDKFVLGFILYIDQFASLPQGMTLNKYFSSAFPDPLVLPDFFQEELFKYADLLGIGNIVNSRTLEQSFVNPSGGETKRIIFLRYILPILMRVSKVQIMFLDEVSAGLDDASFTMVRTLLEQVINNGVKVVSIDHHDYQTDLSVEVLKKVVPSLIPEADKKMPSLLRRMMQKLFPYRYQEEKEPDLEIGEGATDIVVWASVLSIEEPH